MPTIALIYPNQLFPAQPALAGADIVGLVEDPLHFRQYRFHHLKLSFHRASLQRFGDALAPQRVRVRIVRSHEIDHSADALDILAGELGVSGPADCTVRLCDPDDDWLLRAITTGTRERGWKLQLIPSADRLTARSVEQWFAAGKAPPLMASFYRRQRLAHGVLLHGGKPVGGKWSLDSENRKKLPKHHPVPPPGAPTWSDDDRRALDSARESVLRDFPDAPGSAAEPWLPISRSGALDWLSNFLSARFAEFGPFEDALSDSHDLLFHSALSPLLNAGLLLPGEVLQAALDSPDIPLNSREGFVRQLLGWREYMRLVYHRFGRQQRVSNALGFTGTMPDAFYSGTTGLPPFDAAVRKLFRMGWLHHIERLMVVGNLMFLCGVHPDPVYRWFMELFLDAWDWVMVPNVYGMSQYADGGLITTKPYVSGSSYLRKMGAEPGPWTDTWDGLYWRFVAQNRGLFDANPRLAVMTRALDRLRPERRKRILGAAEVFLRRHWPGGGATR